MPVADLSPLKDWSLALAPFAGWPEPNVPRTGKVRAMLERYLNWRAQRETIRLLNAVDPATLRDLGINDIESQVYGAPEGRMRGYEADWRKQSD